VDLKRRGQMCPKFRAYDNLWVRVSASSDREFELFPPSKMIIPLSVGILKDFHRRNFFFIKGEPSKTPHFRQ
jgi:hypothetical protein